MSEKKPKPVTAKELAAIEAVKAAIKALPRSIYMSVDDCDGTVDFWKPHTPGSAYGAGKQLRCKRAFNNSMPRM
jgi:hypothetical protein